MVEKVYFISLTLASSPMDFMSMPSVGLIPVAEWMTNFETPLNLNKWFVFKLFVHELFDAILGLFGAFITQM
ncbi:hypothetical protein MID13_05710 [Vibrio gigantis]|uniref:hypothetical protein n=1 Tax=Vibrio gigantis TaxID=296199 RepID=UPI001EFC0813|nr:hypothetical protein [Vibrio gigantis]ULN65302.1 hypothetical protein MID13_05710 [Vibrio gigantis]